jgi:DNA-binding NarL/FixJ family response regulator
MSTLVSVRGSEPVTSIRVGILTDDAGLRTILAGPLERDASAVILPFARASALNANVDVVLLDAREPDAMACCATLSRETRAKVLFVSAPDDDAWAAKALDAGARGMFSDRADPADITTALRIVFDGLIWAPRRVITARIDQLAGRIAAAARSVDLLEQRLSAREREVFRHAAMGLGNKQLAQRLEISEATVKVHLTHIFQKLGVSGRAELAAAYHGIVNPTNPADPRVSGAI